ncbi:MAG: hypothetical protein R3197_04355 [Paracoccaceae bacterium]|nr:hypothetical protein [Paracoccaceae bacterium]
MHPYENPNRNRVVEERNRLLARIDSLCTRGPKHLATEQRLQAALFIREQYEALIRPKGSLRLAELEDKLGQMGAGLAGIRIHRWMLRASEREITEEMIKRYKDRPEPLKKTKTYFELADALARLAGDDPLEAKIALLRRTNLDAVSTANTGDREDELFEPSMGLLRLVRSFASDTAYRLDLVSLFESAERLQAGWSHQAEGAVFTMRSAVQRYSRSTLFMGVWLMAEIPALPSVRLAEFPLAAFTDAEVVIGTGPDRLTHAVGDLRATWSLRLCIAPDGRAGVTPALIRTSRLFFEGRTGARVVPGETWEITHPNGDGLDELVSDNRRPAFVTSDPSLTIAFTDETAARYLDLRDRGLIYSRTTSDEILPHEGLPYAAIEPLDNARLQIWFRDGAERENHEIERAPVLNHENSAHGVTAAHWFTTPCLARDLELAIRHGNMRTEFARVVATMRRSLEALEKHRIAELSAADRDLLDSWAAERVMLEGNVEGK